MRCMGLTDARRRCVAEAIGETEYCAQHQPEAARSHTASEIGKGNGSRIGTILNRLRGNSSRCVVPDSARFDVPFWLRNRPTQAVIEHLLHDPSSLTRWCAAFTLRKRRDPVAIEPLWQVMNADGVSLVRQQAAVALGKIGTTAVLSPLIEGLWHDPDAAVRQACAIALGNLGYQVAARDIADVLDREQAVFVRWDCVLALGQVGDRTVQMLLTELASTDRTEVVRQACHRALAELE